MSKIRNMAITDKWTYQKPKIKCWLLDDFWPDCVALKYFNMNSKKKGYNCCQDQVIHLQD